MLRRAPLEVIGALWTLLIPRDAFRGVQRFDAFRRDLGIVRTILTDRRTTLVACGVLLRPRCQEPSARDEYRLVTSRGIQPAPQALEWMSAA